MANPNQLGRKEFLYLDDLHVGQRFTSGTHRIDEEQIKAFANQFDPQPFHLDAEAAKNTLFEGLVASGWHTAAIAGTPWPTCTTWDGIHAEAFDTKGEYMKKLHSIHRDADAHWVGDGFPVRTIFSHQSLGPSISPFLLLDYAGPAEFPPSDQPRGVGAHPHRGFETVTIVYQGELEHRDSAGNHGKIGPGDVQWMTAASGIVHEEMHAPEFAQRGGTFEVVQLWVNLPAKFKMSPPRYQELLDRQIPRVNLSDGGGTLRVIAGEFQRVKGPAHTFTPINLWDVRLKAGRRAELSLPDGYTTALFVLKGAVVLNGSENAGEAELAFFERTGERVVIEASEDSTILVLNGEAIDEPVASHGPFVMNTQNEIVQALNDYRIGRMGHLN